jgi:hypothetical protein
MEQQSGRIVAMSNNIMSTDRVPAHTDMTTNRMHPSYIISMQTSSSIPSFPITSMHRNEVVRDDFSSKQAGLHAGATMMQNNDDTHDCLLSHDVISWAKQQRTALGFERQQVRQCKKRSRMPPAQGKLLLISIQACMHCLTGARWCTHTYTR